MSFHNNYMILAQAKSHDAMQDYLGQLGAEIKSLREQYATKSLRKRKHEKIQELKEVGVTASECKPCIIDQSFTHP